MALPTVPLGAFLPQVLPYASAAPRPLAEQMLRFSAAEFCERTRCWRRVETFEIAANGMAIPFPDHAAIHEIESVFHEGRRLDPAMFEDVPHVMLTEAGGGAPPRLFAQENDDEISVFPFAAGTLRVTAFLKPRAGQSFGGDAANPLQDAFNVVPEFLFRQHAEVIAAGALARLLVMGGEEWSDPALGLTFATRFAEGAVPGAGIVGQHRAPRRTRPQFM